MDPIRQRKIKVDRRKSAPSVKVELQSQHGITISQQTTRRRLHEVGLFGRVARKRPYINKINRGRHITFGKNLLASGITSCGQVKVNLTYWDRMGSYGLANGEGRVRSKMYSSNCKACQGKMSSIGVVSQLLVLALWFSSMEI